MKTQSIDTAPKAEKVLIDLYRQASPAKKFALVRSMSETMMQLSRRVLSALMKVYRKEKSISFLSNTITAKSLL